MLTSKPGQAVLASVLALAPLAALAAEAPPLDDAALRRITAQAMSDPALPVSPDETGRPADFAPPAGITAERRFLTAGLALPVLRSGGNAIVLERGALSRIAQTATIDLPRSTGSTMAIAAIVQSDLYDLGGGQSATNLAIAAVIRP